MTRIGIVYPRANLDTVPSLVGAAEAFAERGHDVDLFTYTQAGQPGPRFSSPRIRVRSLGVEGLADYSTSGLRGFVKQLPGLQKARAPLLAGYRAIGAGLAHGSRLAMRARDAATERVEEPFRCVIGVDPNGLVLAHSLAHDAPLGYYSLELLLSYELSTPADAHLKAHERELSRQAAFVVVQDEERGRLLADDNGLAWDRLVLVPNAPPGPARRQPSDYWRMRFGLAPDCRIAVHSGSLGDWTGIEDIVASATGWPDRWVLVIHTRYAAEGSAYMDGLRTLADPRRVHFSLQPVPREEYDVLIDGADVGLAFYIATGDSSFTQRNVQTIGLSSGKLAYYLRAGLPVVINREASIAGLIESSGCGMAVDDASGIGAALARIDERGDQYSYAARRFFDTQLNFQRAFEDVLARVEAM